MKKKWINLSYLFLRCCLVLGSLVVIKQESQLFFSAVALVVPKRGNKNKILWYKINPWFITRFSGDSYINIHSFPFTKLFVFNEDKKTIAFVFDSIVNACRTLTLIKFPLDGKIYDSDLTKNKNIQFIWCVINKRVLTNTEVGKFYIFLNPGHCTSLALVVWGKNLQSIRLARNYSTLATPRPSVENFQLDPAPPGGCHWFYRWRRLLSHQYNWKYRIKPRLKGSSKIYYYIT